jgi:hypothetical protein
MRAIQALRKRLPQRHLGLLKYLAPDIFRGQGLRASGEVPRTDAGMRLTAAHALVEPDQGTPLILLGAPAQSDGDPREQLNELARGLGDPAVIGSVRIPRPISALLIRNTVQRDLHIPRSARRINNFFPKIKRLPPRNRNRSLHGHPSISLSTCPP